MTGDRDCGPRGIQGVQGVQELVVSQGGTLKIFKVIKDQEPGGAVVSPELGPAARFVVPRGFHAAVRKVGGIAVSDCRLRMTAQPFGGQARQQTRFADTRGPVDHQW